MSLTLVWRKKCGCRAKAPEGDVPSWTHSLDWDQMTADNAAKVPTFCLSHRPAPEEKQENLF